MEKKRIEVRSVCMAEDIRERCSTLASYLIEHKTTVRAVAIRFGISKSTVHKDITQLLPYINPALYRAAKTVLEQNKAERHLRGGEATRQKYLSGVPNNGKKKIKDYSR